MHARLQHGGLPVSRLKGSLGSDHSSLGSDRSSLGSDHIYAVLRPWKCVASTLLEAYCALTMYHDNVQ